MEIERGGMGNWPAIQTVMENNNGRVTSVVFSPDGKHLASGFHDSSVRVWDAFSGVQVGEPLYGHTSGVTSVAFSPDGKHLVSGSDDNSVRVWDAFSGEQVGEPLEGHTNGVMSVAFSPDGKHLASGSVDNSVRVWDTLKDHTAESLLGQFRNEDGNMDIPDGEAIWTHPIRFSNRSSSSGGWITGPNGELLFWVPPWMRSGLYDSRTSLIIGRFPKTKLDLSKFVHGPQWQKCYSECR